MITKFKDTTHLCVIDENLSISSHKYGDYELTLRIEELFDCDVECDCDDKKKCVFRNDFEKTIKFCPVCGYKDDPKFFLPQSIK